MPARRHGDVLLTTCAMVGISLSYSAQINLGTPYLLHLGLPSHLLSLAWLAGPLSGLIVQPLVGHFSDVCTHPLGRRRPFLLFGSFLTAVSLILFANSHRLAKLIVHTSSEQVVSICIAIAGFFCMDFCIQVVQAPLRALVTDVFVGADRHRANSLVALFTGVGNLLGGLLSGANLGRRIGKEVTNVDVVFVSAALVLFLTTIISVLGTKERALVGKPRKGKKMWIFGNGGRERIMEMLKGIPRPFWQVFCVQLCTWCGFFTLFVYVNSWVGTNVFGGDASGDAREQELFARGVRFGGVANALMALVTVGYSALLPRLVKAYGVRRVYAFSQAVEAVCLMATPFIRGNKEGVSQWLRAVVLVDVGMVGIVWATTLGLPWTLVGNALESDERYAGRIGLFTTLFNASQSFPQLVVAFVAYPVLKLVEDSSIVMFLGGLCSAVGGILVLVLRIEDVGKGREGEDGLPKIAEERRK